MRGHQVGEEGAADQQREAHPGRAEEPVRVREPLVERPAVMIASSPMTVAIATRNTWARRYTPVSLGRAGQGSLSAGAVASRARVDG